MNHHSVYDNLRKKWEALPIKHRQWLVVGGVMATLTGVGAATVPFLVSKPMRSVEKPSSEGTLHLHTAKEGIDPHKAWRQHMEADQKVLAHKIDQLTTMVNQALKKEALAHEDTGQSNDSADNQDELRVHIQELQRTVDEQRQKLDQAVVPSEPQALPPSGSFQGAGPEPTTPLATGVTKLVITPVSSATSRKVTVDNTVPAGSFARAVLLGGVDASTSVQASNDPRPVLLRLVDKGTLPRQFRSDLKHCHVLASSYGDLSSERVFMRLEKLTCVEELTGEIVETQVNGYIAGEDGRAGVRGVMVDKAGEQLRTAFVGGFLGGLSEYLTASLRSGGVSVTPLGSFSQVNPVSKLDMLKGSAGRGMNNAFERFAEFYIKRAEQLQPVLQVAAGRIVDVVFTQGTALDQSTLRQAVARVHDQARHQTVQALQQDGTALPPLPTSEALPDSPPPSEAVS